MIKNFTDKLPQLSQYKLILGAAVFMTAVMNFSFYKHVLEVYAFDGLGILHFISLPLLLIAFSTFLFTLLSSRYTTKPILIFVLMASSFAAYFMDTYNVVIDDSMLRNALQTNLNESSDLFTLKLVFYVLLLGILPSFLVYKMPLDYGSKKSEFFAKLKVLGISLGVILLIVFSFSKFYTSFFREHKPLRYYTNPTYWIYSVGNYIGKNANPQNFVLKELGRDAHYTPERLAQKAKERRIMIVVVGEAARADRFSLNGYERETNPLLKQEDIFNLSNVSSCGTSTAESVPCMFSVFGREDFNYKKGVSVENALDVLAHSNEVAVLWRDNNSDSKAVALRVAFEDFRKPQTNTICDEECRDEGMLVGLDAFIQNNPNKDIMIVLHQMGNHGPAYYKRYPKEFEKFTPTCQTNQLESCTQEEVSNAYDNAILYTDYFLSKVIAFLKPYSKEYATTMLYMSDHGESLGENGLYLHGIPYFMAPEAQTHVGAVLWLGERAKNEINVPLLEKKAAEPLSYDNIFDTILGTFGVTTTVYKKQRDILDDVRKNQ
jgi:lipid A ethanolaminephosphotransferase